MVNSGELADEGLGQLEAVRATAELDADLEEDPDEARTYRKVARAAQLVQQYGLPGDACDPVDTMMVDLFTDLRHLCAGMSLDFEALVARSADTFTAEDNWTQ